MFSILVFFSKFMSIYFKMYSDLQTYATAAQKPLSPVKVDILFEDLLINVRSDSLDNLILSPSDRSFYCTWVRVSLSDYLVRSSLQMIRPIHVHCALCINSVLPQYILIIVTLQ